MEHVMGIKPYVVLATRKGSSEPTPYLTASFDAESQAWDYIKHLVPDNHTARVYSLTAKELPAPRIKRWGTCVDCPRGSGGEVFPERCKFTNRSDHNLTSKG